MKLGNLRVLWGVVATLAMSATPGMAARQRVLYLGDSMSMGAFGKTLDQRMREAGMEVYTVVTGGATPYYWLKEFENISCDIGHWVKTPSDEKRIRYIKAVPKVEDLLAKYNPDMVVVQTGVNLYSTLRSKRLSAAQGQATVESLVEKMSTAVTSGGRRLYWITPPDSHPQRFSRDWQEQMRRLMKLKAGAYGRVFDSWAVTKFIDPYPQTDGIHYGATEAVVWANCVAEDLIRYATRGRGASRRAVPVAESQPSAGHEEVRRARIVEPLSAGAISVEARLLKKSTFETPSEIPYRSAYAIYEYEVLRVFHGAYTQKRLRVAHTVVWDRKVIASTRDWELGKKIIMELVPLSNYPSVERTFQEINTLDLNSNLTVYIPKM